MDEKNISWGGSRKVCPNCNTAYTGNFCPKCGKKAEMLTFCPVCGVDRKADMPFCENCGFSYVGEVQAPIAEEPTPTPQEEQTTREKKKAWSWKALVEKRNVIIATSLLLMVAIVLGAVFIIHGFSNKGPLVDDSQEGEYIEFGMYPQTIKHGSVDILSQEKNGYYLGSDGEYYVKMTANPAGEFYKFSSGQDMVRGGEYYFKLEPIKWRVLEKKDGSALLLCDSILTNYMYDDASNNYKESDIRAWLNGDFYNTIFTSEEQNKILTTEVDNSAASAGYASSPYDCENTQDKVFLLSCGEAGIQAYGFVDDASRVMKNTDYAKAHGSWSSTQKDSLDCGVWSLRSPHNIGEEYVQVVDSDGNIHEEYTSQAYIGVVPAIWIQL